VAIVQRLSAYWTLPRPMVAHRCAESFSLVVLSGHRLRPRMTMVAARLDQRCNLLSGILCGHAPRWLVFARQGEARSVAHGYASSSCSVVSLSQLLGAGQKIVLSHSTRTRARICPCCGSTASAGQVTNEDALCHVWFCGRWPHHRMLPCAHKKVLATTVALKLVGNAASGMLRVLLGLR
jgi:hypothetical protein